MAASHRAARRAGPLRRVALTCVLALLAIGGGGAWATGLYPGRGAPAAAAPAAAAPAKASAKAVLAAVSPWRTGWALSLAHPGEIQGSDLTCRLVARVGLDGSQVRFRLVNYPATSPVTFTHLVAAVRTQGLDVDPASRRAVTVGGRAVVTLAAGAEVLTDPIPMPVHRGQDLTLSLAVGAGVSAPWHFWSPQSSGCTTVGGGDTSTQASGASFSQRSEDRWLDEVRVLPKAPVPTVAVYGDSLTDGLFLPVDTEARWTDLLQARIQGRLVALNFGVAGDQITGRAPLGQLPSRVASDVMAPAGVSAVVVEMGSNDVKAGASAQAILAQYRLIAILVAKAHETLIVATVPGRGDDLPAAAEHQRQLLNAGLRAYPIVADLDAGLTDPQTHVLRGAYDIGDHVHPNTAGVDVMTRIMRDAIGRVPGALGVAAAR